MIELTSPHPFYIYFFKDLCNELFYLNRGTSWLIIKMNGHFRNFWHWPRSLQTCIFVEVTVKILQTTDYFIYPITTNCGVNLHVKKAHKNPLQGRQSLGSCILTCPSPNLKVRSCDRGCIAWYPPTRSSAWYSITGLSVILLLSGVHVVTDKLDWKGF